MSHKDIARYTDNYKPLGRPLKLTEEYIIQEGEAFKAFMGKADSVFIKQFSVQRGYCFQTITEMAKLSLYFADILNYAKEWQESKLISLALFNMINVGMAKFMLINHHGYRSEAMEAMQHNQAYVRDFIDRVKTTAAIGEIVEKREAAKPYDVIDLRITG
jgi:hypothetical protein